MWFLSKKIDEDFTWLSKRFVFDEENDMSAYVLVQHIACATLIQVYLID